MRNIIATAVLGSFLLGASLADARNMTKFTFTDVTFPDSSVGTIRAGTKSVRSGSVTVCEYFTSADAYLGQYQEAGFTTTDALQMEYFCLVHYFERV